jgi:hypothetical protein
MEFDKSIPVKIEEAISPSACQLPDRELDPALIMDQLPSDIRNLESPVIIRFKSGIISVDIDRNMFLSKFHRVDGSFLYLGYRKLELKELRMEIVYKVKMA